MLAERHRLRPRQAFDLLRSVARSAGRVIEVAETVVDSASNPLLPLPEELARKQAPPRKRGRGPGGGCPASTECRGAALESWQMVRGGTQQATSDTLVMLHDQAAGAAGRWFGG